MKKSLVLLLFVTSGAAIAQDFGDVVRGTASDAKYLVGGYVAPFMRSFGYGLNQGWYNSAATHKVPGFDLTVSVSPVFVPTSDQVFEVDNTKLSGLYLSHDGTNTVPSTGKANVPTFFGSEKTPSYTTKAPLPASTFSGLPGIDFNFLPVPIANLGIGLPKGFDLKIRWVPTLDLAALSNDNMSGEFGLFGVGVMHDVKQYIPGIKSLPFDLSGFVGYTKMKLEVAIPEGGTTGKGEFSSSATTIQGLISKKLAVLTAYAGVGYNIAKTKLAVKGSYDLNANGNPNDTGEKDPFSLEESSSGPRMTAGLRLKLAVFAFHGDYTLQKYNTLTVGFGINVR